MPSSRSAWTEQEKLAFLLGIIRTVKPSIPWDAIPLPKNRTKSSAQHIYQRLAGAVAGIEMDAPGGMCTLGNGTNGAVGKGMKRKRGGNANGSGKGKGKANAGGFLFNGGVVDEEEVDDEEDDYGMGAKAVKVEVKEEDEEQDELVGV